MDMNHNLGEQMKGALNEALETGNYSKLQSLVSDTVTSALNEAGATASKAWQQKEAWKRQQAAGKQAYGSKTASNAGSAEWKTEPSQKKQEQELYPTVRIHKNGYTAGILYVVFGAIANVPLLVLSIVGLALSWGATGALIFALLVSIYFICLGKSKIQLVSKAKRYVKMCGTKRYAEVEELASQMGVSPGKVVREIRKILREGIIPSAHIDKKGTCLMLTDEIYRQYMDAEKAWLLREKEEKSKGIEEKKAKESKETLTEEQRQQKRELSEMIGEGRAYIQKLRDMNDLIPGEQISSKLYQMENLLKEIFRRLEKEPVQMNRMHKLMNYYLPTTLKLVEAYHEFDVISSPGEEIKSAKKEIEDTLDTINDAFTELLNSLFQDKVFDITTDAQVLQTMLANEGLTKEMDFVKVER